MSESELMTDEELYSFGLEKSGDGDWYLNTHDIVPQFLFKSPNRNPSRLEFSDLLIGFGMRCGRGAAQNEIKKALGVSL